MISENEPEERIPGSTPYIKKVDQRGKTTWTQVSSACVFGGGEGGVKKHNVRMLS